MAINQPPIHEDSVRSSWEYELTASVNGTEERLNALLRFILQAEDLDALKELVRNLK